jgi:hypothetical protein
MTRQEFDTLNTLAALALDLKRASLGIHRGSIQMARQFEKQAMNRKNEINQNYLKTYLQRTLKKTEESLHCSDEKKKAEDLLTYSVIFQNYAQKALAVEIK